MNRVSTSVACRCARARWLACLLLLCSAVPASAQQWHDHPYWERAADIPVSGRPVPELSWIDEEVQEFMATRSIPAGQVAVALNGRVVFMKGYGHNFSRQALPENAPFRQASISKPITAAAIQHLIGRGLLSLEDFAFDRGQQVQVGQNLITVGGILPSPRYAAFGTPTARFEEIRVRHLLQHTSGLRTANEPGDHAFQDRLIAEEMGVPSPPGRVNMVRWVQGKALHCAPGTCERYSNIGYLVLGEIVETVSGLSVEQYVRTHILTPQKGVPVTELYGARSFRSQQSPREPYYKTLNASPANATGPQMVDNVFDNQGAAEVERAYGGHNYEDSIAFGGFVASPAVLLAFGNEYQLGLGTPIGAAVNQAGFGGSLPGHETILMQEEVPGAGRLVVYVAFNFRPAQSWNFHHGHWPSDMVNALLPTLRLQAPNTNFPWPATTSDGFWTQPGAELIAGVGGYNAPFRGFQRMLNQTTAGSRIRLKPGSQNWTGVLDRPMVIDAPEGAATLGAQ